MNRYLAVLAACLMLPAQGRADVDIDDLLAVAFSGDIAAIESRLDALTIAARAGDVRTSDLRNTISVLARSHPDLRQFAVDWLAAVPESPHAKTVRALQLWREGWNLRGPDVVSLTQPEALEAFNQRSAETRQLIHEALALEPRYMPAAALLMEMHNVAPPGGISRADFFAEVMAEWPDRVLLIRRGGDALPQWGGGGWPEVEALCVTYADRIVGGPAVEGYDVATCLADVIWSNPFAPQFRERTARTVADSDLDIFDWNRPRAVQMVFGGSPEMWERLAKIVAEPDFADLETAHFWDYNPSARAYGPPVWERVQANAERNALKTLESDPLSVNTLDILLSEFNRYSPDPAAPATEPRTFLPYALKRVEAAPYDWRSWSALARSTQSWDPLQPIDPVATWAATNAIAWSGHQPVPLFDYMTWLGGLFHNLGEAERNETASPEQISEVREMIVCPAVRANRLFVAICETYPNTYGCPYSMSSALFVSEEVLAYADEAGQCFWERSVPLGMIAFSKSDISEMPGQ